MSDRPIVPSSRVSALIGWDGTMGRDDGTTECTPRTDEQPQRATEEAGTGKAHDSEKPVVILPAEEFKITEVLRHVEAGRIVLIIPGNQQRAPPAA